MLEDIPDNRKLTIISITVDSAAYHVQSMWTRLAPSGLMSFASAFSSLWFTGCDFFLNACWVFYAYVSIW